MTNTPDISSTPGQVQAPTKKNSWNHLLLAGGVAIAAAGALNYKDIHTSTQKAVSNATAAYTNQMNALSLLEKVRQNPSLKIFIDKNGLYEVIPVKKSNAAANKPMGSVGQYRTTVPEWAGGKKPQEETRIRKAEATEDGGHTLDFGDAPVVSFEKSAIGSHPGIVTNENGYKEYIQSLPKEVMKNMPTFSYIQSRLELKDKFDIKFMIRPGDTEIWIYSSLITPQENTKEYDEVKAREPYRLRIGVIDTSKKTFTSNPSDYFHYTTDKK